MTQSLLHWVSSPLGLLALLLWISLALLTLRQCQRWARERNQEKVIYQNHPAIPVKVYDQSGAEPLDCATSHEVEMSTRSQPKEDHISPSPNAWDV
ncbi:hypothetical protein [Tunicatimonas pelagia]|uniref:hypothetical protein n=1 Tax=Tunicatimonas pelagia TaxID=931531 RepID=UPI00266713D2|nr:hypothetical protein [Tunicatimonas pelagia]WKN44261.1 hypothetical protein P0M28_04695 [Tunicatimonas pelagia]